MKIKLIDLFKAYNVFLEINKNKNLSFKISYWCMKNLKYIETDANFYIEERDNLFNKYLEKDEKGFILTQDKNNNLVGKIKEGMVEEFSNKMNELENMDCMVEPYELDVDYLLENANFNISGEDLSYINFSIKD